MENLSSKELRRVVGLVVENIHLIDPSHFQRLRTAVDVAENFRRQAELSTDLESVGEEGERREPTLGRQARELLDNARGASGITLADQSLLAALVISEVYGQEQFSSRQINDQIEECGRPRVVNISSALSRLTERSYLVGENNKSLRLSPEGHAKAKGLVEKLQRDMEAA